MRVLILGGSGMLGHRLWREFSGRFDTYVTLRRRPAVGGGLFPEDRAVEGVSAEDFDSVVGAFARVRPRAVVNCVGVVKQQGAAKDPVACVGINALFPHRLARLCRAAGARLLHLSTDCVFSGRKGNYSEDDAPDAKDLYGRSKLLGEVTGPGCLTLRTSIIGRELGTRQGLVEWFLGQAGKRVSGYRRAVFSGLTTGALSRLLGDLLADHPRLDGLWHVAAEPVTKYDLLRLVREAFAVDVEIEPDDAFNCDRSLCGDRFRAATGWAPLPWPRMIADLRGEAAPQGRE
jgi:dTDP-4-dehydrorhamnose reductase